MATSLPAFSDLPLDKSGPKLNAWGLYGKDDQLGFLNRITDSIVVEAAKEIKTGHRISLNWPLDAQADTPSFGRQPFKQELWQKKPRAVHDDVWTFNTQSSTQWDGFRHFGYLKEHKFYNGVTVEQISGADAGDVLGIGAWSAKGLVSRGILVDLPLYYKTRGIQSHDPFTDDAIPLSHIQDALRSQDVEPRFGDLLFVRSGFMASREQKTAAELSAAATRSSPAWAGVEQSEEVLRWIWDHFAAVAGDQPAFECWPTKAEYAMHEVLLGGWGCPIGEYFYLEDLSRYCEKHKRWTFFVSSEPCNVPGGVASPPNILAIF